MTRTRPAAAAPAQPSPSSFQLLSLPPDIVDPLLQSFGPPSNADHRQRHRQLPPPPAAGPGTAETEEDTDIQTLWRPSLLLADTNVPPAPRPSHTTTMSTGKDRSSHRSSPLDVHSHTSYGDGPPTAAKTSIDVLQRLSGPRGSSIRRSGTEEDTVPLVQGPSGEERQSQSTPSRSSQRESHTSNARSTFDLSFEPSNRARRRSVPQRGSSDESKHDIDKEDSNSRQATMRQNGVPSAPRFLPPAVVEPLDIHPTFPKSVFEVPRVSSQEHISVDDTIKSRRGLGAQYAEASRRDNSPEEKERRSSPSRTPYLQVTADDIVPLSSDLSGVFSNHSAGEDADDSFLIASKDRDPTQENSNQQRFQRDLKEHKAHSGPPIRVSTDPDILSVKRGYRDFAGGTVPSNPRKGLQNTSLPWGRHRREDTHHLSRENLTPDEYEFYTLRLEAFGQDFEYINDGPRMIVRRHGRTCVHFINHADRDLFDEIVECKENENTSFAAAMDRFVGRPNADALVRIAYSDVYTHWEAILKVAVPSSLDAVTDTYKERAAVRARFEQEILKRGFFIVRERGIDADVGSRKADQQGQYGGGATRFSVRTVHFLKIIASFDGLCSMAEMIKLKMEVSSKHRMKHEDVLFRPIKKSELNALRAAPWHHRRFSSTSVVSDNVSQPSWTGSGPSNIFSNRKMRKMRNMTKAYVEGPDGTIIGTMNFLLTLVPNPVVVETEPFSRSKLDRFEGGDHTAPGLNMSLVHLQFFSSLRRNLLVRVAVQQCKIHMKSTAIVSSLSPMKNLGINDLLSSKCYIDFFPVHDGPHGCDIYKPSKDFKMEFENDRSWLAHNWALFQRLSLSTILSYQPLRRVRNYFGERTAFFFAFLGFYTLWLWLPSFFGLVVFLYGILYREEGTTFFDNKLTVPYAFLMSVWARAFLDFWRRQESILRTVWDVNEVRQSEIRRPEWYGTVLRRSPITGKIELHFPAGRKVLLKLWTTIVLFFALLVITAFEVFLIVMHKVTSSFNIYVASIITSALALFNIIVLTPLYMRLSFWLTRIENHKTNIKFDDSLIMKNFIFGFVNNYSSLLYLGVFKVYFGTRLGSIGLGGDDICKPDTTSFQHSCMNQLMLSMLLIFVGLQFFNQVNSVFLPLFVQSLRKEQLKRRALKITDESPQYLADNVLDTWLQNDEFSHKFFQFGFVALFSCAFPLAPLLALINNEIEIRFAAYRLVVESRRPWTARSRSLGAWSDVGSLIARIGVITNALIIGFSSGWLDTFLERWTEYADKFAMKLAFVVLFEHAVLITVFFIDLLVPKIPSKVAHAIERQKYLARLESGEEVEDEDELDEVELVFSPQLSRQSTLRSEA